jgi:hypothetical protein
MVRALALSLSLVSACDLFPDLPCEDDINCPDDLVCCDGTCMDEEDLDPEDAFDPEAVEAGCAPR